MKIKNLEQIFRLENDTKFKKKEEQKKNLKHGNDDWVKSKKDSKKINYRRNYRAQ